MPGDALFLVVSGVECAGGGYDGSVAGSAGYLGYVNAEEGFDASRAGMPVFVSVA